jgi:glycine oxidase
VEIRKVDFLIAGQGLSGSLLAWFLIKAGKKVLVVDPELASTSSKVAAGMIHPVTGRRIVKSWNADEFIPYARSIYKEIETEANQQFFYDIPVLEIYQDHGNRNDWMARAAAPSFQNFIGEECSSNDVHENVIAPLGAQWVYNCGWLDTVPFLNYLQHFFKSNSCYQKGNILSNEITIHDDSIEWNNIIASSFISCTGYEAMNDKLWSNLNFNPAKGEVVKFKAAGIPNNCILHNKIKIIPDSEGNFRSGASYDWTNLDTIPSKEGKDFIQEGIEKLIKTPFEIIEHAAGVRPATKDRRPLLGKHPTINNVYIFNGMGSKGVMMIPLLATKMLRTILQGEELYEEYDIRRLFKLDT